jgi:DNA polymerase
MTKEIIDETLSIAREIENHLKFFREIGLEDIGGSALAAKVASTAHSTELRPAEPGSMELLEEAVIVREQSQTRAPEVATPPTSQTQAGLFAEASTTQRPVPSRRGGAALPIIELRDPSLDAIREDIGDCRRCRLHEQRRTIVFGEGNPKARLMFVGKDRVRTKTLAGVLLSGAQVNC